MEQDKIIISNGYNWFNSEEYLTDLDSSFKNIMKNVLQSNSEATTASIFENEIYHMIKNKTGVEVSFKKEVSISGISNGMHKFNKGRMDAVVNDVIIEYKHHTKLQSVSQWDESIEQVEKYLIALKENENIEYNAILTSGIGIIYFSFANGVLQHSMQKQFCVNDLDIIIKAILNNNTKKFVTENILKDFSISHLNDDSKSKSIAIILYKMLKYNATDKTKMLFEEWKTLMHLSEKDNGKGNDIEKRREDLSLIFNEEINTPKDEYIALYSLQTVYSIIVKLITCKIIDRIEYDNNTKLQSDISPNSIKNLQLLFERIEDGYSYRNNNLINLLEGDFFSWYADKSQWSKSKDFSNEIEKVINIIDLYSAFSFNITYEPIDIFKDLYMSIIPSSVRHSTGEYFTPKWLADYVVKKSITNIENKKEWKAIDPCCGSGIFLISLIKEIVGDINIHELSNEDKEKIKSSILKRVYGIDINPLSVLSARVGYFLALQPFGNLNNIEIPVYLGDSAIIPRKITIDNIECYQCSIQNSEKTFDCVLPKSFVEHPDFSKRMNLLQACANIKDVDLLYNSIKKDFTTEEQTNEELMNKIKDLSIYLLELKDKNCANIWIRIITNFMSVAKLSSFDIIVGNPPWVKWEHLPEQYAQKIKDTCEIKHIFSGQGYYGGTQLNVCALISNVAASNWLKENGILAFLMPDSIMSQNSYEEFRNFYIDYDKKTRLYLQNIDKWDSSIRPFSSGGKTVTQDFNTYYYGYKEMDYQKGIPVTIIKKEKKSSNNNINKKTTFDSVKNDVKISESVALQLHPEKSSAFSYAHEDYDFSLISGESAYLNRTGVEFTPQEVFMFTGYGISSKGNGYYKFKNINFPMAKYHVTDIPEDGWDFPVENIYPIATAPNLSMFSFKTANKFCIFPYSKNDISETINVNELQEKQIDLFTYLAKYKYLMDSQSEKSKKMRIGKDFYALSKIGIYTFAPNIVIAKDNGSFCASVIDKVKTPWGNEVMPICVKHTIIISQRKNEEFINEDESHYICGILNSDIIRKYIKNTFKSNGISLNESNIYLPLFDDAISEHKEISELAKQIKNQTSDVNKKLGQIFDRINLEYKDEYKHKETTELARQLEKQIKNQIFDMNKELKQIFDNAIPEYEEMSRLETQINNQISDIKKKMEEINRLYISMCEKK